MPVNPGIKNLENTQFGRVATPAGNRNIVIALTDWGLEPLVDNNGRLIVRLANGSGFLPAQNPHFILNSGGYVETVNFPTSTYLHLLSGFNNSIGVRYIQVFLNSAAIPAPASVPDISFIVPTQTNFSFQPNGSLLSAPAGISVVSSTTGDVYTPSGTLTDLWVNIELSLP